jgi:hypothetical protein
MGGTARSIAFGLGITACSASPPSAPSPPRPPPPSTALVSDAAPAAPPDAPPRELAIAPAAWDVGRALVTRWTFRVDDRTGDYHREGSASDQITVAHAPPALALHVAGRDYGCEIHFDGDRPAGDDACMEFWQGALAAYQIARALPASVRVGDHVDAVAAAIAGVFEPRSVTTATATVDAVDGAGVHVGVRIELTREEDGNLTTLSLGGAVDLDPEVTRVHALLGGAGKVEGGIIESATIYVSATAELQVTPAGAP